MQERRKEKGEWKWLIIKSALKQAPPMRLLVVTPANTALRLLFGLRWASFATDFRNMDSFYFIQGASWQSWQITCKRRALLIQWSGRLGELVKPVQNPNPGEGSGDHQRRHVTSYQLACAKTPQGQCSSARYNQLNLSSIPSTAQYTHNGQVPGLWQKCLVSCIRCLSLPQSSDSRLGTATHSRHLLPVRNNM